MKRTLLIPALLLCACTSDAPPERPGYVLPDDSLSLVLAEMHIIGSAYQHRVVRRSRMQDYAKRDLVLMLDSIGVSRERLDSSLSFYKGQPERLEAIYDKALNILSTRLAEEKARHPESDTLKTSKAEKSIKELMEETGHVVMGQRIPLHPDEKEDKKSAKKAPGAEKESD